MLRYKLRTLLILLAVGPRIVAVGWWLWGLIYLPLLPLTVFAALFIWGTVARMYAGLAASAHGDEGFLAMLYTITIAVASVGAGLLVAYWVYVTFGDFPRLYGGMAERTPRVAADFSIALAIGAVPGALLFWLTWPRQHTTVRDD